MTSLVSGGCAPRDRPATPPDNPADLAPRRLIVYEQASRTMNLAAFLKPDPAYEAEPIFPFAPLIVVETTVEAKAQAVAADSTIPEQATQPGIESASSHDRPTVYFAETDVHFGPVLRRQVIFVLFQAPTGESGCTHALETLGPDARWLAVRFTLSEAGLPMIAEILHGPSRDALSPSRPIRTYFVSNSLEAAARSEFGPPLPHRRSSVEPSVEAASDLAVAATFEDPPVVSGPYLYLTASECEVVTILCRCSPSQVRDFSANRYYQLQPILDAGPLPEALQFVDPSPLTQTLRLPEALP